ncbi:MAG: response regulator [Spirochaetes bacterium]|nr:response regulator [Spirochaetota bacterium]MBN2771235.1 response regulator [Spirochaetota bacterium]
MKVVLVEDERIQRTLYSKILNNYEVVEFTSAEEALPSILTTPYDCGVFDLNLPGMSGAELLREIRKTGNRIPVALITAYASIITGLVSGKDAEQIFLAAGFDIYFEKSVRPSLLIDFVEQTRTIN